MRCTRRSFRLLATGTLAALLILAGLVVPAQPSLIVDDAEPAVDVLRRGRVDIKAGKVPQRPWVVVDVGPTLRGARSHRVVLQARRQETWVKCAAVWTDRSPLGGPTPNLGLTWGTKAAVNEYAEIKTTTCPGKANKHPSQYRVVVRSRHGFERTVSGVQWVRRPSVSFDFTSWDEPCTALDVNPTLRGDKSYRVILQERVAGGWQRVSVLRTQQATCPSGSFASGVNPHEAREDSATYSDMRVIVPKQHGFSRRATAVAEWRLPVTGPPEPCVRVCHYG